MTDSARTPLGGDQACDDLIVGYVSLSKFLTSKNYPISKSSLQKLGMPSGGGELPRVGYWGGRPAFKPDSVLEWARSRIRPSRGKAAAPPQGTEQQHINADTAA
jgi:hypothetical protein